MAKPPPYPSPRRGLWREGQNYLFCPPIIIYPVAAPSLGRVGVGRFCDDRRLGNIEGRSPTLPLPKERTVAGRIKLS